MRTVKEVISAIPNSKVFSVLDAKAGFLPIKLDEPSYSLTLFNTPIGRFRWLGLPFMKCSPEIFWRIVDNTLEGISGAISVMDDIPMAAPTIQEHEDILQRVVEWVMSYNLRLNFSRCHIYQTSVQFLGHLVTAEGRMPDPAGTKAVQCMPLPSSDEMGFQRSSGRTIAHSTHWTNSRTFVKVTG